MMLTQTIRTKMHTKMPPILLAVAVLVVFSLWLLLAVPRPASAFTTFTVNQITDVADENLSDNLCDINSSVAGDQCTLRAAIQEANDTPGADTILFNLFGGGVVTIKPTSGLPAITDPVTLDGYSQYGSSPNAVAKGTNAKLMIELDGSAAGPITPGLQIEAPNVVIKGLVINHFSHSGITIDGLQVHNSKVEGNFIGTDPSGTKDLGNSFPGVRIGATAGSNTIGGSSLAARNLISGNDGFGVQATSDGNEVSGNLIGTQRDGKSPLGNGIAGVELQSASNIVYANVIAFNNLDGVDVEGSTTTGNEISRNSIFSNGGLGVDLVGPDEDFLTNVSAPNDPGDTDKGANRLQNKPVITSAKKSATGKTTIKGKLNSTPNKTYTLQFFKNPKGNEGKTLLFSKSVSTDGSGNVSFTFSTTKKVALGQNVTATATNSSTGDTSEFSAPKKVVAS